MWPRPPYLGHTSLLCCGWVMWRAGVAINHTASCSEMPKWNAWKRSSGSLMMRRSVRYLCRPPCLCKVRKRSRLSANECWRIWIRAFYCPIPHSCCPRRTGLTVLMELNCLFVPHWKCSLCYICWLPVNRMHRQYLLVFIYLLFFACV